MHFKKHDQFYYLYLEAGPEGLQALLEVSQLLPDSAAEAAGSTAGWAVGLTGASARPGGSEPARWPWAPLAVALCGWETRSCGGGRRHGFITKGNTHWYLIYH